MTNFTLLRYLCRICLLVYVLSHAPLTLAQGIQVIDLRHRPAEQVIPLLAPIVGERGAVTGQGFKLIVRGDAVVLRQVRVALEAIDTPMKRLMISVRQVEDVQRSQVEISGGAVLRPGNSVVTATAEAREASQQQRVDQRVQGLDGSPAFISMGEQRVLPGAVVTIAPRGGTVVNPVVQPVEASTGFYVLPRVVGQEVQLDIAPQKEAFGTRGEIRRSAVVTQARGLLGEWIDLGGTEASSNAAGSSWLGWSRGSQGERMRLQVKVEEIK